MATHQVAASICAASAQRSVLWSLLSPVARDARKAIRYAFHQFKGNHTRMRKSLGVSKKTMLRKLAALGLRKPLASRVRHLTEHDIARSFQKHRLAIAGELKIHDSTLMRWLESRLPALVQGDAVKRARYPVRMDPAGLPALEDAIRHMHGAEPTFVESVGVRETFNGATVWDGEVQVFELRGHPRAVRAYAWSHETEGAKRRFFAVLHEGPIDSPVKAVRAAIVAGAKHR